MSNSKGTSRGAINHLTATSAGPRSLPKVEEEYYWGDAGSEICRQKFAVTWRGDGVKDAEQDSKNKT
jgi:hypothetical protein